MFRLTPFENLDSINYEGYYQGLFKHLINGGILRVQDTEDMSIKSYNLEQLRDFVKTNKVYFIDYEICYDEDDECFTLEEVESTDISGSFLNGDFKLSFGVNTFLVSIFDDAVKNEVPYKDGNILNITFNENKFNFSIIDYYWQSNEKDLILLSVNNNPLK